MFACLCHAVTETTVQAAATEARSLRDLTNRCGIADRCGSCTHHLAALLRDVRAQTSSEARAEAA